MSHFIDLNKLVLIISLLGVSFSTTAQPISQLPKFKPSYAEDFKGFKSYPSLCFQDIFVDKHGKLWLTICKAASSTGINLFQFDGYEFRLVKGALGQLKETVDIAGLWKGEILCGFVSQAEKNYTFFYHLQDDELQIVPIQVKGNIRKISITHSNRLILVAEELGIWKFYEWKVDDWVLFRQLPIEYQVIFPEGFRTNIISVEEQHTYWKEGDKEHTTLKSIPIDGSPIRTYLPKAFEVDAISKDFFKHAFVKDIKGETYVFKKSRAAAPFPFYRLDKKHDVFSTPKWMPTNWSGKNVFADQSGNVLFLFLDEQGNSKAILKDREGKRFDYSAFFENLPVYSIRSIRSHSFQEQLLVMHDRGFNMFLVQNEASIMNTLFGQSIRAMIEVDEDHVLVNTQSRKLFLLNKKEGSYKIWEGGKGIRFDFHKLEKEHNKLILARGLQKFYALDVNNNKIESLPTDFGISGHWTTINTNEIVFRETDYKLKVLNRKTGQIQFVKNRGENLVITGRLHQLLYSKDQLLWAATSQGLYKIDLGQETAEKINFDFPFVDNRFLCISEDEKGRLWLGTPLDGLYIYNPKSGETKKINSTNGLCNNTIASITIDDEGDRWLGTYNGITLVSSEGVPITNLYAEDGLVHPENNRYASLKTKDGKLLIGTVNGLNIIDPVKIKSRLKGSDRLSVYLTKMKYFESSIDRDSTFLYNLETVKSIKLPASRRYLDLEFATSNYFNAQDNQYAYKLEGIDKDWTSLGNQRQLNLTNLPVGKYQLMIRGSDNGGNWAKKPLVFQIHAQEHFYRTLWFYLLCLLLLGGLVSLWILRLRRAVKKATHKIQEDKEIIEAQAEQLKALDQTKSQFFTNISHEFRTPLTIISGMANQIEKDATQSLNSRTRMIKSQSKQLLRLINQILDLRKLESEEMEINYIQGDIIPYLKYVVESFESLAKSKELNLHFLPLIAECVMDYDRDKMLSISTNLLSNAIKFTPTGGNIYFQIDKKEKNETHFLSMRIQDTGVGITEKDLSNIFNRFYQANSKNNNQRTGTGIGLALTKQLINLLKGEIEVSSELGEGTTFSIMLPITNQAHWTEPNINKNLEEESSILIKQSTHSLMEKNEVEKPHLLIVEDNLGLQEYLMACLNATYQISIANNGQEGIEKAIEQTPDLILSDVMMPEKDGYELVEALKNDERTDHIPIVLLTAKADLDSKVSGLKIGADAHLSKPFEESELLAQLDNLFRVRQKLQVRYGQFSNKQSTTAIEDPFLKKFYTEVENEISNTNLGMVQLSRSLGMSRSQLFRKTKALTGKSPSTFIRSIRLQKGKQLLETTDLSVSQVAYEVGFTSLNYFSRTFIEEFGINPTATRK